MKRRATALVAALACGTLGACASTSDNATKSALTRLNASPTTTTTTTAPTTTTLPPGVPPCDNKNQDASKSLRPLGPLPAPGDMPPTTFMHNFQTGARKLVVGVDENTLLFSARDPKTRQITGLEIDIVYAIAAAIGPDVDVTLKPVVTENKTSVVKEKKVDLTVSAVSMTCDRLQDVLFSSEYFTTDQKLLVRDDSDIEHASDLAGKTVCMTAGSSSIKTLETLLGGLDITRKEYKEHKVPARTDCLLELQEGTADAYFGHETFLYGMAIQDPTVRIVDESESTQHYGIAIAKDNPDFVRFVNGVLEQMRADGSLQHIYDYWLGNNPAVPSVPAVPAAQYKD